MIPSPPPSVRTTSRGRLHPPRTPSRSKLRGNADDPKSTINVNGGDANLDVSADAFWVGRSVYQVPEPPSGSFCVLQNDLLCSFGGLMTECPSMLFQTVPRDVALQPSTRSIYLRSCTKRNISPLACITDQLSTTPGRYMLLVLECSGTPLSADAMASLLPVMKANRGTLHALNFRSCCLHDGAWRIVSDFLVTHGASFVSLESLELSCNRLTDDDACAVLPQVIHNCPRLGRVGVLKNNLSRSVLSDITEKLHQRARLFVNADSRPYSRRSDRLPSRASTALPEDDVQASPRSNTRSPRRGDYGSSGNDTTASIAASPIVASSPYPVLHTPHYECSGDEARLPRITKAEFQHAVSMYRQFMTSQTALLDPHVLQQQQPATFDVFRRQTSSMPVVEHVTLPRYLCACFPGLHPNHVMYALGFYSEYSLTTVVRKVTHDGLRPDQKAEVMRIFSRLDKDKCGVLPLQALLPPRSTPSEVHDTVEMLARLGIQEIDFDAFAKICAPYLVETRRRRRLR
jgi:hypothetical protein